jgi:phosphomannomutase
MREEDAVFAGEVSAHYYFRDFSQADSGVVPFLLLIELISKRGRKLSELLAPYLERAIKDLQKLKPSLLLEERYKKFRKMGVFERG